VYFNVILCALSRALTPETGLSKSEAVGNFEVEEMFALSNPLF